MAGKLRTHMLCRHRGQAGGDGGLQKDTAEAVCGGGCARRDLGLRAGQVHTGGKLPLSEVKPNLRLAVLRWETT